MLVTFVALFAGCATMAPNELVNARSAYQLASQGPAQQLVQDERSRLRCQAQVRKGGCARILGRLQDKQRQSEHRFPDAPNRDYESGEEGLERLRETDSRSTG